MLNDYTQVPQVEFHGTGMRVNGAEVSGEVILAWLAHSADRGYALKADKAIDVALTRTEPQDGSLAGLLDATLTLQEIARSASL